MMPSLGFSNQVPIGPGENARWKVEKYFLMYVPSLFKILIYLFLMFSDGILISKITSIIDKKVDSAKYTQYAFLGFIFKGIVIVGAEFLEFLRSRNSCHLVIDNYGGM
jgi:hypothetical protein